MGGGNEGKGGEPSSAEFQQVQRSRGRNSGYRGGRMCAVTRGEPGSAHRSAACVHRMYLYTHESRRAQKCGH